MLMFFLKLFLGTIAIILGIAIAIMISIFLWHLFILLIDTIF